jgi:hypothetical protein
MASVTIPRWLRITLIVIGLAVLTVIVGGWLFLRSLSPLSRCDERRFTPARWNDTTLAFGPAAIRGCVVDDLLRREKLRGRTRAEIVALLGEPPRTDYFRDYDLVYWLGPERGMMSIDSEWLVFRLDSTGRVIEHRLVTD